MHIKIKEAIVMSIEPLDIEDYWKAVIDWAAPRKWHKDKKDPGVSLAKSTKKEYGIYRFERRHGNQKGSRENLYIGIAYKQDFETRLHQGFHEKKLKKTKSGEIWVAAGLINLEGSRHKRPRYEEIEKLLIYFTEPVLNDKKKEWGPDCYFEIINKGYRGPLPKYIKYPVAEIKY